VIDRERDDEIYKMKYNTSAQLIRRIAIELQNQNYKKETQQIAPHSNFRKMSVRYSGSDPMIFTIDPHPKKQWRKKSNAPMILHPLFTSSYTLRDSNSFAALTHK